MIQLTRTAVIAGDEAVATLRAEFQTQDWVRLPQLLDPALLAYIVNDLEAGGWSDVVVPDFYAEAEPLDGPAVHALMFLANRPDFLALAHEITGCGPFTWFDGRVYRMAAGRGHHDHWHSDWSDGRRVALSLNLGRRPYDGGDLQMRPAARTEQTVTVTNREPGDAILFRLGEDLVHRVGDVAGASPKTAFAGWFTVTERPLIDRLHELVRR